MYVVEYNNKNKEVSTNMDIIRNRFGYVIGRVDTCLNGDKTVFDSAGHILGYYDKGRDVTYDSHYREIATGDCTAGFLMSKF